MSYKEFCENTNCECGPECQCVANDIKAELQVSQPKTLTKLMGIHAGTAAITLSICPQFGLNPLGSSSLNLFEAFMYFGHGVCSVLCGLFFLGMSLGASQLFLSFDEWRVFRQNYWKFGAALVGASLLGFAALNADFSTLHLELWVVGTALALLTLNVLNLRPVQIKEKP